MKTTFWTVWQKMMFGSLTHFMNHTTKVPVKRSRSMKLQCTLDLCAYLVLWPLVITHWSPGRMRCSAPRHRIYSSLRGTCGVRDSPTRGGPTRVTARRAWRCSMVTTLIVNIWEVLWRSSAPARTETWWSVITCQSKLTSAKFGGWRGGGVIVGMGGEEEEAV